MARIRRRPSEEAIVERAAERDLAELPLASWLDRRAVVALSESEPIHLRGNDAGRLAWYRENHPEAIRSEAEVRAEAETLERARTFQATRREARLRGLPAPTVSEFIVEPS